MKLGVDFGTTRIVVAAVDRGNYPIVSFDGPDGAAFDWFPPLVAVRDAACRYGWKAWEAQSEPGWTVVRSLKRLLEDAGPQTCVDIAGGRYRLLDLLASMAATLRRSLLEFSSLRIRTGDSLDVMLGVPANANSNQRFLTTEAFRLAGFPVVGLLNEPSAASIEFGHRNRTARRDRILVYDLGGGTFDASLVELDELTHSVVASEGISTLGGDDFDEILAEIALAAAGLPEADRQNLSQAEMFRLHEECRSRKEALNPNSRKITVDLEVVRPGWGEVSVPVSEFYDRCRPLMEETLHAVDDLLSAHGADDQGALEALYITGGGSELPLVARVLREQFGRRVRRSAYTRSATAIGLAIQADTDAGYQLREKFTRNFGVWREAEGGQEVVFDVVFPHGTPLPGAGEPPLISRRRYQAVHNVGHFRYLEASHVHQDGQPAGDLAAWDEIRFPFDPSLREIVDLNTVAVTRTDAASHEIEERFGCDSAGAVSVTIANLTANYSRTYRLGRWSSKKPTVSPGRRRCAK